MFWRASTHLKKKKRERQIEKKKVVPFSFLQYYLFKLLHVRTGFHGYVGLFYSVISVNVNAFKLWNINIKYVL